MTRVFTALTLFVALVAHADEPNGMPPLSAPPQLVGVGYQRFSAEILIWGQVLDDGELGGLLVDLQGSIGNQWTWTDEDGHWAGYWEFGGLIALGTITVTAFDADGQESNVVTLEETP